MEKLLCPSLDLLCALDEKSMLKTEQNCYYILKAYWIIGVIIIVIIKYKISYFIKS